MTTMSLRDHDTADLRSRATRGFAVLTALAPGWYRDLDDDALDLADPARSPVEYAFPDPESALAGLAGLGQTAPDLGLCPLPTTSTADDATARHVREQTACLTSQWRQEIRDRQEADRSYTVFGLTDLSGELTVAGVVEGCVPAVDADWGQDGACRYATSVIAEDPDEAEALAVRECRRANGDTDEDDEDESTDD
jgi:hypothetical protein